MNWEAGSEHDWPTTPFRVVDGDLLLVVSSDQSFGVLRLDRTHLYPGLSASGDAPIRLSLRAIQTTRLEHVPGGEFVEGLLWLDAQISQDLGIPASAAPSSDQFIHKPVGLAQISGGVDPHIFGTRDLFAILHDRDIKQFAGPGDHVDRAVREGQNIAIVELQGRARRCQRWLENQQRSGCERGKKGRGSLVRRYHHDKSPWKDGGFKTMSLCL